MQTTGGTATAAMKLRAVIFDYGNVICRPPTEQQISEAAALCGITVDEFLDAFWRNRREYDRGIDAQQYWKDFAEHVGRDFDDALIHEMIRREIDFWTVFDMRVLNWTKDLRRAELQNQHRFSNLPRTSGRKTAHEEQELSRSLPISIDVLLRTRRHQARVAEIYHDAIRGLGVRARRSIVPRRSSGKRVEGGRAAGIHAEIFTHLGGLSGT